MLPRAVRSPEPRRLLLLDDDPSVTRALEALIHVELPRVTVDVAETCERAEQLVTASRRRYAAAVVDLGLPDGCGATLLSVLHRPDAACCAIVISGTVSPRELVLHRGIGAVEVLPKPFGREAFMRALRRTIGETLRYRGSLRRQGIRLGSIDAFREPSERLQEWLVLDCGATAKEAELAHLVRDGATTAEIAARRGLNQETVRQRLRRLMRRCMVDSKPELAGLLMDMFPPVPHDPTRAVTDMVGTSLPAPAATQSD